jgi:superfamily I DNA and/or RNA helicase
MPNIGILDEAAQVSWADAYCFLVRGMSKVVFVGDDKQLSPTVISQNEVLKQTLFSELMSKNTKYSVLLNIQYRMHPAIADFPNRHFYSGLIKNGVTAADRKSHVDYFRRYPVSFINTESTEVEEIEPMSGKKNYWNPGEVRILMALLAMFPKDQLSTIGIISPYDLQVQKINEAIEGKWGPEGLAAGPAVRTCESYQGSESEYTLYSCVRSNKEGKIGFCGEENRFNVAVTRAKKGLALVGNRTTFLCKAEKTNIWRIYLEYLEERGLIIEEGLMEKFVNSQKNTKSPLQLEVLEDN